MTIHLLLQLDAGINPSRTDLVVSVAPDDDTVFEIRRPDGGPTVGIGFGACLGVTDVMHLGGQATRLQLRG